MGRCSGTFADALIFTLLVDCFWLVLFKRLAATMGISLLSGLLYAPAGFAKGSLFRAVPVDPNKFVLVAAPIGQGERAQLNIYEQRNAHRPCFSVSGSAPAMVNPLLSGFDFTGLCSRYIDANGYSLRIGGDDLGTHYRLSVLKTGRDIELLASPTRDQSRPSFIVARTGGDQPGFLQFNLEQGWRLMRRAYGNQSLGHLYLYRDAPLVDAAVEATSEPLLSAEPVPLSSLETPEAVEDTTMPDVTAWQASTPSQHHWSPEVLVDEEEDDALNWPYLNH